MFPTSNEYARVPQQESTTTNSSTLVVAENETQIGCTGIQEFSSQYIFPGRTFEILGSVAQYFETIFQKVMTEIYETVCPWSYSTVNQVKQLVFPPSQYDTGICNGWNTCYIHAVLQALRFLPSFRQVCVESESKDNPVSKELIRLFNILDGGVNPKRSITSREINAFRSFIREHGFTGGALTSEDVAQFCQFLLDQVGVQSFEYKNEVFYDLDIPIPSLDRQRSQLNYLLLDLEKTDDSTSLQNLIVGSIIEEIVEPEKIARAEGVIMTDELAKTLSGMAQEEKIVTLQSKLFSENAIPVLLPLQLKRFSYDKTKKVFSKVKTKIIPNDELVFPLEHSNKNASFRLCSIIVHIGNYFGGHYYVYIRKQTEDGEKWVQYDDLSVKIREKDALFEDEINTYGYLFFYEFVQTR